MKSSLRKPQGDILKAREVFVPNGTFKGELKGREKGKGRVMSSRSGVFGGRGPLSPSDRSETRSSRANERERGTLCVCNVRGGGGGISSVTDNIK